MSLKTKNNDVDIVLISSPMVLYKNKKDKKENLNEDGDEKSYYPINILYLTAYLEKFGHKVKIIDVSMEGLTLDQVVKKVDLINPKMIGISSMTTSIQSAVTLAKALKKKGRTIGLGGVHLTCDPTFIDRFPVFDWGIVGEGEVTLLELVEKSKKGEKIKGLFQGKRIEDLDTIPFPARHHVRMEDYRRNEESEVPAAGILASRGCPYNCVFCCIPARGKMVRFRSPKNIVDEMEEIYEECQGKYSFVDDCFTINNKWVSELCQEIMDRKMKVSFVASTRADTLTLEMAKMMKKAGCTDLFLGIESGNDKIRNEVIGKRLKYENIVKAVKICRKVGILSNLFLMVGFPGEGIKEALDTVRIGGRIKADIIGIHVTIPMPGSRIYDYAIQNKLIPKDIIDRWASGKLGRVWRSNWPLFVPEGMTLKKLFWIKRITYMYFYFSPFWWYRRIKLWFKSSKMFFADMRMMKIAFHAFTTGGTKGQLS